jgi:hypothetical protein
MKRSAYNPQKAWCSASNQRLGGGAGNGDAASGAAAAPFGGFGFFGRIGGFRTALGGGPAGGNSATTGLGSTESEAGTV